jgi:Ca2+-binding RTX toxin-like protein
MSIGTTILGTPAMDFLFGTAYGESILAGAGDDLVFADDGDDWVYGEAGFDSLFGGKGDDKLFGGTQNDNLYGDCGDDVLHGDSGLSTIKGSDFGSDNLVGGDGNDKLYAGDGNDTLSGGAGKDSFHFKWQDPMINLAALTGRAFATITDFDPNKDRLVFDVAGVGKDAVGANFVNGSGSASGGAAATFYKGAAGGSNGEAVMILTDQGFASGTDAVGAAQNEATGDFVLYFNTTVNVASLLFVDGPDAAHSIARFTNIDSLEDLQMANFQANDFLFA